MTLAQFEPKAIKIGIPHDDYSAMQGPCPSGFHVPLNTEWQAVYNVWTALGGGSTDGTNFGIALKLPFAGYREAAESGTAYHSGGLYWSSSRYNANNAYYLNFQASALTPQSTYSRASGMSVRCFKDAPTIPTVSWTKLYGTSIEAGGIFWSNTDGLISLSSNGQTWITIADKNLGATTVWNSGNTLSEANCGKYYQWGNNYGFPRTGSMTTSSTKVDASNYGPGNYYSSSTFITISGTPYRWDTTDNGNLRGGVTGIVHKTDTDIKKVYLGSTQVRPTEYTGPELCFTANTAGSTIQLTKTGRPTSVALETSTDGENWSTYTIGNTITLSNIGDKVYWRNTSTTDTGFSTDDRNCYKFVMTGSIAGSGDINYLLNKNSTTTLSSWCFTHLFDNCTALTSSPTLPATTLANCCYYIMFAECSNLTTLPSLPALSLPGYCCYYMFKNCSKIKLSSTQTGEYQTAYRIPTTGTGTLGDGSLDYMFYGTGGRRSGSGTPTINRTYYTSNTVV